MPNTSERKDVYSRITVQIVEYLERGVRPGHAHGTLNTPPAELLVLCDTTASSIPESMCFPPGCPALGQNFAVPIWIAFRQANESRNSRGAPTASPTARLTRQPATRSGRLAVDV
jgi:hypothetical protein